MKRFFIILFFIIPIILTSQNFSYQRGIPFIKNYLSTDYNAHEQNFDIVQDNLGVMYFANFEAVVIYDGAEWTKIPTKSGMRVLSLAVSDSGVVYVGGLFDFGYISRDKFGQFAYHSLADSSYLPDFIDEVFSVVYINDKVYFVTKTKMFVYDNQNVTIVNFKNEARNAFKSNNNLFIFFKRDFSETFPIQNGLTIYNNGDYIRIKDNTIAQISAVVTSFYFSNDTYIIGTENQGFFQMKNNIITDFDVPINDFAKKNTLTSGTKISDDLFAMATLTQGVLLVNSNGEIQQIINKKSSLKDEAVNAIYLDNAKNLWVATNNGISMIEINNAVSSINNVNSGINGKINKILKYNDKLFFATDYGLYVFFDNKFTKIPDLDVAVWDAKTFENQLLLATPQGLYTYSNGKINSTGINEFSFCISIKNNKIFVGTNSQLFVIQKSIGSYSVEDTLKGFAGNVIKILCSDDFLYAEVPAGKVYKIDLSSKQISLLKTGREFISLHLNKIDDKLFFSSEKGLWYDKPGVDTIVPYNLIADKTETSKLWLYEMYKISDTTYFFNDGSTKNPAFLTIFGNNYRIFKNGLLPISDFSVRTFYLSETNNKIWLGGNEGCMIYDLSKEYYHYNNYPVFFTSIELTKNDSLLSLENNEQLKLKYIDNSLIFRYSASYYPAMGKVYYRHFLQGYDQDTSEWTTQTSKEYTNLSAGNYNFYIEAKDQFGNIIKGVSFEYKVLVPLYLRWWMVIIYIVILVVSVKFLIDWRIKISEKEKEKLEEIIKERTAEIEKSKAEIEAQRDIEYAQRKEIMSSIRYAKRIQHAVLPHQEVISKALNDNYFILFRPYEVVSGDFFWLKELKNFVAVVAADCTGHGVPGAFMSMLGTSFLNEIVTRRSLDSAAEVLERLRNKVKASLHQKGKQNEQKDGMDIAFYFIDKEAYEVQFAGAYNPLYIVRHNSKITDEVRKLPETNKKIRIFTDEDSDPNYSLIELKANRQPIGIYIRELPFENISFKLERGDCLYTFSDGYQDQFGGPTGDKFNSRNFKKLFLGIQDKTMAEQHQILDQHFIKWKGDLNQIDDVLVMGVKIDF